MCHNLVAERSSDSILRASVARWTVFVAGAAATAAAEAENTVHRATLAWSGPVGGGRVSWEGRLRAGV